MDFKSLGNNIRKFRRIADLTQEQLAEICDCSNSHIGQIENAKTIPSLEMTMRIANALRVTIDQLVCESYTHSELIYLKEIESRISKFSLTKRMLVCEELSRFLDALEKFNSLN